MEKYQPLSRFISEFCFLFISSYPFRPHVNKVETAPGGRGGPVSTGANDSRLASVKLRRRGQKLWSGVAASRSLSLCLLMDLTLFFFSSTLQICLQTPQNPSDVRGNEGRLGSGLNCCRGFRRKRRINSLNTHAHIKSLAGAILGREHRVTFTESESGAANSSGEKCTHPQSVLSEK